MSLTVSLTVDTPKPSTAQTMTAASFRQISGTITAAARGEPWAEASLAQMGDVEIEAPVRGTARILAVLAAA